MTIAQPPARGVWSVAPEFDRLEVSGATVTVEPSDPGAAPPPSQFEADLSDELGPGVAVVLK